jgi:DcuC family C4-dicarboxylate transporter
MLSLLIALAVTAVAGWLIVRNYQPQTVLLLAGLLLLGLTALLFPENSVLYQKAKSTGWKGFDVFAFVKEALATQVAGIGLIIMSAAAFADYMDHIGATGAMVRLCLRPLQWVKAPYVILALGYLLGQCLHVAIPSAAGLAMLLLVTFFPVLVSLGVSKPAAAAMVALTSFMDLGPAVGTANLAAKTAGVAPSVYFVKHQMPVALGVMVVVALLIYVTARRFDMRAEQGAGAGIPAGQGGAAGLAPAGQASAPAAASGTAAAPGAGPLYALLPLLPIALILVFSPLAVSEVNLDVVTAMLLGALAGLACELLRRRELAVVLKGFQVVFNSMGSSFASVVSLLVCADVFAQGLQAVGAVGYLIDAVSGAGFSVHVMALVMTLMVGLTAAVTGSGVAAFFAFSGLAPAIAAKFGVSTLTLVLPMQLMAGMGRAISPVAGVVIAVSKAGDCPPMAIVRRTLPPALGGMVTMLVLNYLLNG